MNFNPFKYKPRSFYKIKRLVLLLSLTGLLGASTLLAKAESPTSHSISISKNYRMNPLLIGLSEMSARGWIDSSIIQKNTTHYFNASESWQTACLKNDKKEMRRVLVFAQKTLEIQLSFGTSWLPEYFNSIQLFKSDLARAEQLIQNNQCNQFHEANYWHKQLSLFQNRIQK